MRIVAVLSPVLPALVAAAVVGPALFVVPVQANNTGIFGKTGRDEESGTCLQCHFDEGGSLPAIEVTGLDGNLAAGTFVDLTVTVRSTDPSGGIAEAACPARCAGVNVAIDVGAGTFVVPDGEPVQVNPTRDEISHIAKSPFVDGAVTYRMALAGLTQGNHTLYVAANDVDGQNFTGDRVRTVAIPFSVGPPVQTAPPPETPPGCSSAAPAGPLAALMFAILVALPARHIRRRRR